MDSGTLAVEERTGNRDGWITLTACPICGSESLNNSYLAADSHYGIKGLFQEVQCGKCSTVFLNPMPTHETLSQLYPETYYSYQDFLQQQSPIKKFVKTALLMNAHTKDPHFEKPGRVVDIGCGSGHFLYELKLKGWDTYGVEISDAAADVGRNAGHLDIFSGTLEDAAFPDDHFDYVRSNHSFEHLTNPIETLKEMRRILKPDGKLFIGIPNFDSWNRKHFKENWWYLGAPVHPFSYSADSFCRIMQSQGFVVEALQYNSVYSGGLGSWQMKKNRGTNRLSTEGSLYHNTLLAVLFQRYAKLLDLFKMGDAIEVICHKTK